MNENRTIEINNLYREIYRNTITIKNVRFNDIDVEYSISEYRGSKLLKYKYLGYDSEFKEYDFGEFELNIKDFTVPKYLEGSLDYIYMQIKVLSENEDMNNKIDKKSIEFLNFFESKLKDNHDGKND